ncbi:MAG TPA: hypothetical protein VIM63_01565 [Rhodoferax sp.]
MFGHKPVPLRREFEAGCFSMDAQAQVLFTDLSGQVSVLTSGWHHGLNGVQDRVVTGYQAVSAAIPVL